MASFVHNADTVSCENQLDFVSELIWNGVMKTLPALDTSQGSTAAVFIQLDRVTTVDSHPFSFPTIKYWI